MFKKLATLIVCLVCLDSFGQQYNYFINQFLYSVQNAAQARQYFGIGTNTPSGSGSVTNFAIGNLSPLFTAGATTPTTYPHVTFSPVSQSANLFFASPNGISGTPSFRSIISGDLPDISTIVRGDVSATAPVLYDSGTGIFSMHVADATHDGYLSSSDWNSFNAPHGGGGVDIPMTNLTAFANGTNFYLDFNWPAQTVISTGDIAFNFSTNWGLSQTSKVASLFFPATNIFRHVLFLGQSTNWHATVSGLSAIPCGYSATVQFQLFGIGETNTSYIPRIDTSPTGTNWIAAGFNPTNSQDGCVLWLEASQGACQDEYGTVPAVPEYPIRSWRDLVSGGRLTNNAATSALILKSPNTSPGNIPAFNWTPTGTAWLASTNFSSDLAQPNWAFIMYYGRGSSLAFLDGLSEGHRFAFIPSESPSVNMTLYSGSSINVVPVGSIAWRLFAVLQNGASSIIRTNGVQVTSGNSGSQAPGRWVIGSDYNLGSFSGNSLCSEVIIYHTNLTSQQITNVENYFRTKYGAW